MLVCMVIVYYGIYVYMICICMCGICVKDLIICIFNYVLCIKVIFFYYLSKCYEYKRIW